MGLNQRTKSEYATKKRVDSKREIEIRGRFIFNYEIKVKASSLGWFSC